MTSWKPVSRPFRTTANKECDRANIKSHASLAFKLSHLGFSNYTARFASFDAKLQFDPATPTAAKRASDASTRGSLALRSIPPARLPCS